MKSVAFLRNTWKKWEQKTFDGQDTPPTPQHPKKTPHRLTAAATGRSLTVTIKHLPSKGSSTSQIEGSWHSSGNYQPPSPAYSQFTQDNSERTLVHRNSGRFNLGPTYCTRGAADSAPNTPTIDSFPPPTPPKSYMPWSHEKQEVRVSGHRSPADTRHSPPPSSPGPQSFSQRSQSISSSNLLSPIDLQYGPGNKHHCILEGKNCVCVPSAHSRSSSQCPMCTFSDAHASMAPISPASQRLPHPPRALLDSHDTKLPTLYYDTGSTPHLPYREHVPSSAKSNASWSVESDTDRFPLSLFPLPPPLIVRKKVPAPLVLRPALPTSSQSSLDSTPVGTPTNPRYINSPSQSNNASPTKKFCVGRPSASFSPPPFSPPNSPLPKVPVSPDGGRHSSDQVIRPLRYTKSDANLRDTLLFPATHRLTSSEPIPDQSLPIRRLAKLRPAERPKNIQTYFNATEEMSNAGFESHVQWGYAF